MEQELQQKPGKVQADVDAIATHVHEFVCSTNSIASLTQQIREIADQTDLLALIAAIEAARADEQGRETNGLISQESAEASGRIEHLALILKNKVAYFKT